MNRLLAVIFALSVVMGCHSPSNQSGNRTAEGLLTYYPENEKNVQAFYGHNFMVGDTPVIPTPAVSKEILLKLVGKEVTVTGVWYPGYQWQQPKGVKGAVPIEATKGPVTIGDGIKLKAILPK
jgi:hypothetical protein